MAQAMILRRGAGVVSLKDRFAYTGRMSYCIRFMDSKAYHLFTFETSGALAVTGNLTGDIWLVGGGGGGGALDATRVGAGAGVSTRPFLSPDMPAYAGGGGAGCIYSATYRSGAGGSDGANGGYKTNGAAVPGAGDGGSLGGGGGGSGFALGGAAGYPGSSYAGSTVSGGSGGGCGYGGGGGGGGAASSGTVAGGMGAPGAVMIRIAV